MALYSRSVDRKQSAAQTDMQAKFTYLAAKRKAPAVR